MLRVGSLFTGIGGFDLGIEYAGLGRTVWMCEKSPYRRQVLAKNFPGVPVYDDVTRLWNPPPVDLICGGFPCQDISAAGKGEGLEGKRSGLWFEFERIIALEEPLCVLVENVASGSDTIRPLSPSRPPTSEPLIDETESSSSGSWPTPTRKGNDNRAGLSPTSGDGLSTAVKWPSPRRSDGSKGGPNQRGTKGDLALPSAFQPWSTPTRNTQPGTLNPEWVEMLMSYPIGWTDISDGPQGEAKNNIGSNHQGPSPQKQSNTE